MKEYIPLPWLLVVWVLTIIYKFRNAMMIYDLETEKNDEDSVSETDAPSDDSEKEDETVTDDLLC